MARWRFKNVTKSNALFWPLLTSVTINNEQPCDLATLNATIVDEDADIALDNKDEIVVEFAADNSTYVRIFAGDLNQSTLRDMGRSDPRVYDIRVQDYTKRLGDNVIDQKRDVEESVTSRVNWIMGHSTQGITTGGVASISDVMDPTDYRGVSVKDALEQVAGEVGASFYVDFDKELQFFVTPPAVSAPFDLTQFGASPPTSYSYWDFSQPTNSDDYAEGVYVQGDGVFAWRGTQGTYERAYSNPNIKTLRKAQRVGDRILADLSQNLRTVNLHLMQPGLAPMQTVHLTHPTWDIDDDFIVQSVTIDAVDPNDDDGGKMDVKVTLVDRFTPCFLRAVGPNELATEETDPDDGTGGDPGGCIDCMRVVVGLPSVFSDPLAIAFGGSLSVYTSDGAHMTKHTCGLELKWSTDVVDHSLTNFGHEPGSETPVLAAPYGIAKEDGSTNWDVSGELTPLAAAPMDWPRFWVVGDSAGAWAETTNPFAATIPNTRDIAYGGGIFVAVADTGTGSDGQIATSPDGINWTDRGNGGFTTEGVYRVAYGNGLWVATGDSATAGVATSTDGISWTQRTPPWTGSINGIAYGNNLWVAVGTSGKLSTSTDPTTGSWTSRTSGFGTTSILSAAYGNSLWVVAGSAGTSDRKFSSSSDGITWTNGSLTGGTGQGVGDHMAFGGGRWIILADNGHWTSTNGTSWTYVERAPVSPTGIGGGIAIAYSGGLWIAVGADSLIWRSNDGISFAEMDNGGFWTFAVDALLAVAGGEGIFAAAGGPEQYGYMTVGELQSRNSRTGALISSVEIAEGTSQIRATPNAQSVFLLTGTGTFERYGRDLEGEDTLTIAGFTTDLQDWNVDDDYNVYRLAGELLTKYNRDGDELWSTDLSSAVQFYAFPADAAGNGQQVFVDEHVRVVGEFSSISGNGRACLLTIGRPLGNIRSIQKFKSDGNAIFLAGGRNGQCINLVGKHDGAEFEGEPLASGHFLMRIWAARAE